MLLIDGVKYELWIPTTEDEFERIVKEHARDIFGEQSEYFGKQKMESKLGKGSVPDGFVIMFGEPPCWHIVEIELSFHDLHRHIVEQASRFIIGIKNPQTQRKIVDAIYEEIKKDDFLERKVRKASGTADIYKLLTDLISKPPVLTIIIEKYTEELDEALSALAHPQIKVVDLQTFTREDVGLGVHAHLFEPLIEPLHIKVKPLAPTPLDQAEVTLYPSYLEKHRLSFQKKYGGFFPSSMEPFELDTDIGLVKTYVWRGKSGLWMYNNLADWFQKHSELRVGDRLVVEVIEPMKRYRLRKV